MPRDHSLSAYHAKRDANRTPEPFGGPGERGGALRFVVQKHAARNLHWDFRLELNGVLVSWAVPKGPSYDQANKRGAFHVEDHPLEYADFEGIIPEGNYGAGEVIVWDRGTWIPLEDPEAGLRDGKLLFELRGYKLRGRWTLVKTRRDEKDWLLIKERDAYMRADADDFDESSVLSGLTLEELREGPTRHAAILADLERLEAPEPAPKATKLSPMLAETAREPFDDPDWLFEFKFDGYRFLAARDGGAVILRSRNGNDWTESFPELALALRSLPFERFVVDGEVVVHDENGLPSFQRLQKRARLKRAPDVARAAAETPATYYVFDLLRFEEYDVRPLQLVERKRLLREIVPHSGPLRFSDHVPGAGTSLFAQVEALGLEGIIAKRAASPYRDGRSADWKKVRANRTEELVVVGWKPVSSGRGGIGSLHVAIHDNGELTYAGSVGTGFSSAQLAELHGQLDALRVDRPPAAGAPKGRGNVWVRPELVIEVRFLEWTDEGLLRQPVFVRVRDDRSPESCVRHTGGVDDAPPGDSASSARGTKTSRSRKATKTAAAKSSGKTAAGEKATGPPHIEPGDETREVRFTNLDKVFWPEDGYTKGDLIAYYRAISPWLLPYLQDRPIVLTRFPDGIHGKSFFQKDAPSFAPDWISTETLWSEGSERELRYFVGGDLPTLLYLANSASIPLHIWASRVDQLDRPDWCVLDLDPKDAPFEHVVEVARALKKLCDAIELPAYVKTSGSSGLHVLVPLGRQMTHEQSRQLAELIARVIVKQLPDIATIARVVSQREGKVYVDYLQNGHGKLLVAPFSVRPLPGAPVSTPLEWREVKRGLDLRRYTIRTVPTRLERKRRDPLQQVLHETPDLVRALDALATRL